MRLVESQWWTIELPPEWEAEQEDETIYISDQDGVGEIAITTIQKQEGDVSDEELREFSAGLELGNGEEANVGDLQGSYFTYQDGDDVIREWYLRAGPIFIVVSYHCDKENAGMDDKAVDEILSTLAILKISE
jgi:hypothetical protein